MIWAAALYVIPSALRVLEQLDDEKTQDADTMLCLSVGVNHGHASLASYVPGMCRCRLSMFSVGTYCQVANAWPSRLIASSMGPGTS
mmetsp:Transcript_46020/g.68506  ORF Transcript_46020/g.68506 Transcript_46020/m.68506 type:complete len:87 (+) Transcript_46020:380-640(+)